MDVLKWIKLSVGTKSIISCEFEIQFQFRDTLWINWIRFFLSAISSALPNTFPGNSICTEPPRCLQNWESHCDSPVVWPAPISWVRWALNPPPRFGPRCAWPPPGVMTIGRMMIPWRYQFQRLPRERNGRRWNPLFVDQCRVNTLPPAFLPQIVNMLLLNVWDQKFPRVLFTKYHRNLVKIHYNY